MYIYEEKKKDNRTDEKRRSPHLAPYEKNMNKMSGIALLYKRISSMENRDFMQMRNGLRLREWMSYQEWTVAIRFLTGVFRKQCH